MSQSIFSALVRQLLVFTCIVVELPLGMRKPLSYSQRKKKRYQRATDINRINRCLISKLNLVFFLGLGFGQKLGWEMGFGQNLGWEMGFIPPFRTLIQHSKYPTILLEITTDNKCSRPCRESLLPYYLKCHENCSTIIGSFS